MKLYTSEMERVIENNIKPNLKHIYELKIRGLRDKHIAKALGITIGQFAQAKESFEPLKDVYEDAQTLLCSKLREVVIDRALDIDRKTDKDGNRLGPDAGLALRMLDRLDPAFSSKQQVTVNVTVEEIIRGISKRREIEQVKQEEIEEKHRGVS